MTNPHLALVVPTTVNGTVDKAGPPKRRRNAEVRSREYLTDLRRTQAMAVGDQDHDRIAMAPSVVAGGLEQLPDFRLGEVFAGAKFGVRQPLRGDCSIYSCWGDQLER